MSHSPDRYPCPCCGYLVFDDPPGSYDICPICFWEDDAVQLRNAASAGGANAVSLLDGQRSYAAVGASEARFVAYVRSPMAADRRDTDWRPLDPGRDISEHGESGAEPWHAWPDDLTTLYYWRR